MFDNCQCSRSLEITFPKAESFECQRLVLHPLAEPQPAAGSVCLCLFLFSEFVFFFICLFLIETDYFFPNLHWFQFLCINMQKQLVAEHCLLPWLFFHSSVYSIGPDLSSTATHRALLNLAALTYTKQGCSNDLLTITSYISDQSGTHRVALLLGLGEEEAHALTDRGGQWWGGRGAVKGLLPRRCCGVKVPALWPGRTVTTTVLKEGADLKWVRSAGTALSCRRRSKVSILWTPMGHKIWVQFLQQKPAPCWSALSRKIFSFALYFCHSYNKLRIIAWLETALPSAV